MHGSTISCSTDMTTGCRPGCRAMRLAIAAVVAVSDLVRHRPRAGLGCRAGAWVLQRCVLPAARARMPAPCAAPRTHFCAACCPSSGSAPPIVKSIGVMMIILAVLSAVCLHTRLVCIPAGTLCAAVVCVYVCVCAYHTRYMHIYRYM